MSKKFHELLKQTRLSKGLSQKEVSEKLGVAKSTYSMYESGTREPNIQTILKLAELLSIPVSDLLIDNNTYDVYKTGNHKSEIVIDLTDRAKYIDCYDNMNNFGKAEALKRVQEMTEFKKYTDPNN